MRVIAGTARGRRLLAPAGLTVRPTSERLRGALFSMLGAAVVGSRFLDACAGSGAIGIEALSRGALNVYFVEPAEEALAAIVGNLEHAGLAGGELLRMTWEQAVRRLGERGVSLDLAFYDPPYERSAVTEFLRGVLPLLGPGGQILVEHRRTVEIEALPGLESVKQLKAGDSRVSVFARTCRGAC